MILHFIVGCTELNSSSYNIKNFTFNQAPGTNIVISCSPEHFDLSDEPFITTCEDDGKWRPDPRGLILFCSQGMWNSTTCVMNQTLFFSEIDVVVSRKDQITQLRTTVIHSGSTTAFNTTTASNNPTSTNIMLLVPVCVVAIMVAVCFCIIMGTVIFCICQQRRKAKSQNQVYNACRGVDPIYETIIDTTDTPNIGSQIEVSHNDTYKNVIIQASPSNASEINVTKNSAYVPFSNLKEDPSKFEAPSNDFHCGWHTNISHQYDIEDDN